MSKRAGTGPRGTVIAVANNKGGVAKTTTAAAVAYGLSRKLYNPETGKILGRVLIIDLDPQGNQAELFGVRSKLNELAKEDGRPRCVGDILDPDRGGTIKNTIISLDRPEDGLPRENLFLLPASRGLEYTAAELVMKQLSPRYRGKFDLDRILSDRLGTLRAAFRYIVIDCPPKLDTLKAAVYNFADRVIVPVKTDHVSLHGAQQHTTDLIKLSKQDPRKFSARLAAVVPTMYRAREVLAGSVVESMRGVYNGLVTDPIPQAVAVAESSAAGGRCIFEYAPDHPAAVAYAGLVERMAK